MKVQNIAKLGFEDFPGAPTFFKKFIDYFATVFDAVVSPLRNNLTVADNFKVQVIDYVFTNDVEVAFLNQLGQKPVGVWPVYAENQMVTGWKLGYNQKNEILVTIRFAAGGTTQAKTKVYILGG